MRLGRRARTREVVCDQADHSPARSSAGLPHYAQHPTMCSVFCRPCGAIVRWTLLLAGAVSAGFLPRPAFLIASSSSPWEALPGPQGSCHGKHPCMSTHLGLLSFGPSLIFPNVFEFEAKVGEVEPRQGDPTPRLREEGVWGPCRPVAPSVHVSRVDADSHGWQMLGEERGSV